MQISLILITFLILNCSSDKIKKEQPKKDKLDLTLFLQEIIELVPKNNIEYIIRKWMSNDDYIQNVMRFLTSDYFKKLLMDIQFSEEFYSVHSQLNHTSFDILFFINQIYYEIDRFRYNTDFNIIRAELPTKNLEVFHAMLYEVKHQIPMSKILLKISKKVIDDPEFNDFLVILNSKKFKNDIRDLGKNFQFKTMIANMMFNEIDINSIADLIKDLCPVFIKNIFIILMKDYVLY